MDASGTGTNIANMPTIQKQESAFGRKNLKETGNEIFRIPHCSKTMAGK